VYQFRAKIGRLLTRSLLVLAGGAVGSLVRYLAALGINEHYDGRFPAATFLINVSGSFLIGLLLVLLDREDLFHPNLRPLLVTGFLGGYTTFSTFEWETFALGRSMPPLAVLCSLKRPAWLAGLLGWRIYCPQSVSNSAPENRNGRNLMWNPPETLRRNRLTFRLSPYLNGATSSLSPRRSTRCLAFP
jgi:CrcB protein